MGGVGGNQAGCGICIGKAVRHVRGGGGGDWGGDGGLGGGEGGGGGGSDGRGGEDDLGEEPSFDFFGNDDVVECHIGYQVVLIAIRAQRMVCPPGIGTSV